MKTYHGLQGLRYVAALLVVGMHTAESMHQRMAGIAIPDLAFGGIGVDIFFVISGFIMMATTDAEHPSRNHTALAREFLVKRLIRIAPLYWIYTLLKMSSVILLPTLALRTQLEPLHVACSLLLIPCMAPWGLIQPVLPVGWTLSFELLFYLIFAASIAAGRHRVAGTLLAFALIFVSAGLWPASTALSFFAQSMLFEFCLGMLAYRILQRTKSTALGLATLATGIGLLILSLLHAPPTWSRFVMVGVPAFLIVLGVLMLEEWFAASPGRAAMTHLGDSSYSLYLSHAFTVPLAVVAMSRTSWTQPWLVLTMTAVTATLVGVVSFKLIEQPLQRRLSGIWRGKRPSITLPHTQR